jgi:hypothetical protein
MLGVKGRSARADSSRDQADAVWNVHSPRQHRHDRGNQQKQFDGFQFQRESF